MKQFIAVCIFVTSFKGFGQYCSEPTRFAQDPFFSIEEIDSVSNLIYGIATDHLGNPTNLYLDVYYPKTSIDTLDKKPLILMIHGGAFLFGNKDDQKYECIALAQRGFVAATMSYRLGFNLGIPSTQTLAVYRAQQDANAALRYLVEHQTVYEIDTNWIFVGGGSAGAVTINNVAYTDQDEWNEQIPGIENQLGQLDTSGNNLTHSFSIKGTFNNWGAVPLATMDSDEFIPQIAFHGVLDQTVDIDTAESLMGSRSIHNVLTSNNVCSDLTIDPTGGHGIYTDYDGIIFRASKASCFFKSVICNRCLSSLADEQVDPQCSSETSSTRPETQKVVVYPNPANTNIFIEGLVNTQIKVYDALGKDVLQLVNIDSASNGLNINIEALNHGVYLFVYNDQVVRFAKN